MPYLAPLNPVFRDVIVRLARMLPVANRRSERDPVLVPGQLPGVRVPRPPRRYRLPATLATSTQVNSRLKAFGDVKNARLQLLGHELHKLGC